jgi:AcrR family transcriptional regulator
VSEAVQEAPTRRERRRLEIRERILDTALELFESRGYEETTVGEIAERADIAYGTFFNHFPAKLDLLRELADRTLSELFEDVEEVRKNPGSFSDHLVVVFENAAASAVEKGPQARELIQAMMTSAYPELAVSDDRRMRRMFELLLQDGQASGAIRDDVDLETLVEVVQGAWYSLFLSWVHFDDYPLCERAAATARFLARTLVTPFPDSARPQA